MNDLIVPEKWLRDRRMETRPLVQNAAADYSINLDDDSYGEAFQNYLVFSHCSSFIRDKRPDANDTIMLYNRYYWFLTFSKFYMKKHGYDAGMEQQAFKLLETAEGELNWEVIAELIRRVDNEENSKGT